MQVPAPFDYHRATSVDDALGLLAQLGGMPGSWPAATACCP